MPPLLEIQNLSTHFKTQHGDLKAVDDVSLQLREGDTLGIVGESGCGKTVLALSIMRLIQMPPGRHAAGKILFGGIDLSTLEEKEMRKIRGKEISMIFQEPMTSLNPVFRIGDQIGETICLHQGASRREAHNQAIEMLRKVGIEMPEKRINDYPHQLSGGMRQRVMIAMALACRPRLMIADEPTTALDVTIQEQILSLVEDLKQEMGTSVIIISHDLGVIAESAQYVALMYAGKLVEYGAVETLFSFPLHPYTVGLLTSLPTLNVDMERMKRLPIIPGVVPELNHMPLGCKFHERCPDTMAICRKQEPELIIIDNSQKRYVRCWKYQ